MALALCSIVRTGSIVSYILNDFFPFHVQIVKYRSEFVIQFRQTGTFIQLNVSPALDLRFEMHILNGSERDERWNHYRISGLNAAINSDDRKESNYFQC